MISKKESNFIWVQTHIELIQYLVGMEEKEEELVDLFYEAVVTAGLIDKIQKDIN